MDNNTSWIKYLSPFIGILFCPVTLLFLWTFLPVPVTNLEKNIIENVKP